MTMDLLSAISQKSPDFYRKLSRLPYVTAIESEAAQLYGAMLYLLETYRVSLVPDEKSDALLHQHITSPHFEADMKALFNGDMLIHTVDTQAATFETTQQLFEQEFQMPLVVKAADCNILLK